MENIGRFQLLRMLGAGGLSVVYEARDSRFGGRVALKVLRPADLTPMEIARFSREYEVLAKLSHRNLVQVYEYGLDGRRPYFTMELLEGTTLASLTCAEDLPAENLWGERNSFIFGILFSLLDAMEHLHRRGILHRDIKPGNIMLSPAGVKLMDFGLARDASAEAMLTAPGMIMGTLRYCSPEQCTSNAPIDPRADLYAFGVVLYELMVGRPPFSGDGWPVIQQILSDPVPPPSEFNPRLPEAYGALIMRLLEKKPDDRPQTVAEVRIWLSHLARSSGVDPPPREVARYIAPAGMQATCERFLSSVGAGHNGFLLVSGEEGMGKTRLADELETLALARRIKVVRTAGQGGGGSFHAVEPIVRAICGGMSTEELIGRFGDGADGLVNLPQAGHPIFPVVSKVVRYAAHTQPLVLIVDDMHWADYDSFELLSYIVRDQAYRPALGGHGVGVAWTCVAEAEPGLRERMSRLTSGHVHAAFVLPPLLPPDVVDLLVSKLGDEAAATDLAPLLHRATRGNPSFILECLQRLIETAVLVERGGRWFPHPNWDAVGELVESSLSEAFGRQLHGLSEAGIDILSLASLVGTSFSIHVLVACVGSTEVQTAVDELVATGVVRVVPGRRRGQYAFSSARLRRYVVTTMSYAQREALERQILLGLEEAWQAGDRRVLHPLALHSKDLGDLERALHYGLLAAESAASAGANQRAADLYEAAMKMPGFEARLTAGLRDALFDVMMAAGRYGTAEQLALESAQAETERSRQAHWRHRVGRAMMGLGKTEEALPHFSASLEGLGAKAPTWGTKLKGIFDLPSRVRLPQRDQDMVRAINSARQVSDADTRALLQASYALLLVMTSKPPVALIRNLLHLVTESVPSIRETAVRIEVCRHAAYALYVLGDFAVARHLVAGSIEVAEAAHMTRGLAEQNVLLSLIQQWTGPVSDLYRCAALGAGRCAALGETTMAVLGRVAQSWALTLQQRFAEAEQVLVDASIGVERDGSSMESLVLLMGRAWSQHVQRRSDAAALWEQLRDRWLRASMDHIQAYRFGLYAAMASLRLLAAGSPEVLDKVRRWISEADRLDGEVDCVHGHARVVEGQMLIMQGAYPKGLALVDQGLAALQKSGARLVEADARLALAEICYAEWEKGRAAPLKQHAEGHRRAALSLCDELGASAWASSARLLKDRVDAAQTTLVRKAEELRQAP